MKQLTFHPRSHMSGLIIIVVLIIIPIVFQILSIFVHVLIGMLAFTIWTFLFHQTWAPTKSSQTDDDHEPAPAHEDTNDRTRAGKIRFGEIHNLIRRFIYSFGNIEYSFE